MRRNRAEHAMPSLTSCQANRARLKIRSVRRGTAEPATHLLSSEQGQIGCEDSDKGHCWTWHEITHKLSTQQAQINNENNDKGHI